MTPSHSEKNILQPDLFDEAGMELSEEIKEQLSEEETQIDSHARKKHPVRKKLPAYLPREVNECNANIYCVDNHDNIIWQVNDALSMFERDPFVCLKLGTSETLSATRFFGKTYVIGVSNGFAEETGWEK